MDPLTIAALLGISVDLVLTGLNHMSNKRRTALSSTISKLRKEYKDLSGVPERIKDEIRQAVLSSGNDVGNQAVYVNFAKNKKKELDDAKERVFKAEKRLDAAETIGSNAIITSKDVRNIENNIGGSLNV